MLGPDTITTDEEMARRLRPLINDILESFNRQSITPAEAGLVILGLIQRLLEVLEPVPEARRHFVQMLVNVVNRAVAASPPGFPAAH